jgi:hypothetical protein
MPEERAGGVSAAKIAAQVSALEAMRLAELREFWRGQWGAPPKLRSVQLLRFIIAWRLQAAVEGGLASPTRARLRHNGIPRPTLPIGTRLTREYRGVLHSVEIEPGGVSYMGRRFRSLSQVASEITGVHWNGPRFFGLRRQVAP